MTSYSRRGEDTAALPHELELELERNVHAPAIARAAVDRQLAMGGLDGPLGQTIVLLVSEVVTNAVRHADVPTDSPIVLCATLTERVVRVSVTDAGRGFTPRPRDPDQIGDGYGLFLLETAASRWGIDRSDGTTVWFEMDRPGEAGGTAV